MLHIADKRHQRRFIQTQNTSYTHSEHLHNWMLQMSTNKYCSRCFVGKPHTRHFATTVSRWQTRVKKRKLTKHNTQTYNRKKCHHTILNGNTSPNHQNQIRTYAKRTICKTQVKPNSSNINNNTSKNNGSVFSVKAYWHVTSHSQHMAVDLAFLDSAHCSCRCIHQYLEPQMLWNFWRACRFIMNWLSDSFLKAVKVFRLHTHGCFDALPLRPGGEKHAERNPPVDIHHMWAGFCLATSSSGSYLAAIRSLKFDGQTTFPQGTVDTGGHTLWTSHTLWCDTSVHSA